MRFTFMRGIKKHTVFLLANNKTTTSLPSKNIFKYVI